MIYWCSGCKSEVMLLKCYTTWIFKWVRPRSCASGHYPRQGRPWMLNFCITEMFLHWTSLAWPSPHRSINYWQPLLHLIFQPYTNHVLSIFWGNSHTKVFILNNTVLTLNTSLDLVFNEMKHQFIYTIMAPNHSNAHSPTHPLFPLSLRHHFSSPFIHRFFITTYTAISGHN